MTQQEAIRVLMLSPIYFKLTPSDRRQLIREYCALFAEVSKQYENGYNKKK
ncbi:MAG: hypothetical protein KKD01_11935 [Proteobacteria bacterium]|nr:hypothetical protein [Pseudomonadota bacterium]MBU1138119.1 hypothetical protein [Pseudomonadota bacterium]MBU1233454.1 hypothetical protein [Pseudomonadota bacterium]MBU1418229.1 hypothetical protein [Pseudomonadota bacterium]MBU1455429.1 hypothetical protein [Pseudomonadota bacterium]